MQKKETSYYEGSIEVMPNNKNNKCNECLY